jgi:hypothetical protein
VGIVFGQMRDGRIVVERVIPEGPASVVGVQAGDVLQAIDGVPALRMPFKALSCLVPGAAGTLICMTFAREMVPTPPGGYSSSPFTFSCQIRRSPSVVHPIASEPHERIPASSPQLDLDCHRPSTSALSHLPAPAPKPQNPVTQPPTTNHQPLLPPTHQLRPSMAVGSRPDRYRAQRAPAVAI